MLNKIKIRYRKIKNSINFLDGLSHAYDIDQNLSKHLHADILAYAQITSFFDNNKYIPITEYSLRPYTMAHILNDIVLNKRKTIVEFGSGSSTVFIANLIKKNNLETSLYSIDHDKDWQMMIRETYLFDNDLIYFIHAPLRETQNGILQTQKWYDEDIVYHILNADEKADLIIIDGPPGDINDYARYPAVNFINHFLKSDGSVIVDDITRDFEKKIVDDLINKYGFRPNWSFRHCFLTKHDGFNTNPIGRI